MEVVKLICNFKMHNTRIKFKEEQIKKLAHSLTVDFKLQKLEREKDKKRATRRKRDTCILSAQWGHGTKITKTGTDLASTHPQNLAGVLELRCWTDWG